MTAPQLGIEKTGGWSTVQDEADLWAWLGNQPSASVTTLGRTARNRAINMVTYGDLSKPTLLLIGGVHGLEPSGREAMLWVAREVADSGLYADALVNGSIAVIPTVNPDGRVANTRHNNTSRDDPNRDIIKLANPEMTAVNAGIREVDPVIAGDFHEYSSRSADVWVGGPLRSDMHPLMAQHSNNAWDALMARAADDGYEVAAYPVNPRLGLWQATTLMHFPTLLIETNWYHSNLERFNEQFPPAHALADYFANHTQGLQDAKDASVAKAETSPGPDLLHVWEDQVLPNNGRWLNLSGYTLQGSLPQRLIDAHGITVDGNHIPIKQRARGVIPELIDPDASWAVVSADREFKAAPEGVSAVIQLDGNRREVSSMVHQVDGQKRAVAGIRATAVS